MCPSKEFWPKGPGFGLPLKGAVLLKTVEVKSVYLWLVPQCGISQLAGIKLRANRHNGPTDTTFFNYSSLQTLAAILQVEPENSNLA
jgi:hypothetical protein